MVKKPKNKFGIRFKKQKSLKGLESIEIDFYDANLPYIDDESVNSPLVISSILEKLEYIFLTFNKVALSQTYFKVTHTLAIYNGVNMCSINFSDVMLYDTYKEKFSKELSYCEFPNKNLFSGYRLDYITSIKINVMPDYYDNLLIEDLKEKINELEKLTTVIKAKNEAT